MCEEALFVTERRVSSAVMHAHPPRSHFPCSLGFAYLMPGESGPLANQKPYRKALWCGGTCREHFSSTCLCEGLRAVRPAPLRIQPLSAAPAPGTCPTPGRPSFPALPAAGPAPRAGMGKERGATGPQSRGRRPSRQSQGWGSGIVSSVAFFPVGPPGVRPFRRWWLCLDQPQRSFSDS